MNPSFTIAAIATPPGNGGVGIIRLSGPQALAVARRVAPSLPAAPTPRHAYLLEFVDGEGAVLDEGLVLYFAAPRSFTGEEVVELHAHGSARLLQLLMGRLLATDEVRLAEPGEFTRRAFLNGRMDLTQAEAVADLVSAESEAAVRAAAAQVSGALHQRVESLRQQVLSLRADVEASLDFPSEADGAEASVGPRLLALGELFRPLLADSRRGELVRRGAKVVLFGPVNAGKSTLFNALVGSERALVDEEAGTTRDVLEAKVEWEGLGITLLDTAGLREGEEVGRVEKLGIERTHRALSQADVSILVCPPRVESNSLRSYREAATRPGLLEVQGKADLFPAPDGMLGVSGRTGLGLAQLRQAVWSRLWDQGTPQAVAMLSERHLEAVRRAEQAWARALEAHRFSTLEAVAGELGLCTQALGEVTGEAASEELLDLIFQRFCIGK